MFRNPYGPPFLTWLYISMSFPYLYLEKILEDIPFIEDSVGILSIGDSLCEDRKIASMQW